MIRKHFFHRIEHHHFTLEIRYTLILSILLVLKGHYSTIVSIDLQLLAVVHIHLYGELHSQHVDHSLL